MTKLEQAISNAAVEMSREARAELAHRLIAELHDDEQKAIDTAWVTEIRRRVKEIDQGEPLLDGDEVMRRARAMVKK
ncbi:MAG TPA: addiction module protein [Tepidisphaeraceae bacterium]|nr:addiction module protein [Tepidisphaeraceae bacterium]